MTRSRGQIAAVFIINVQYPDANWATVSLLVADVADTDADADADTETTRRQEPRWAYRHGSYYDARLDNQPTGQVALYLSDLLSPSVPVPSAFSRPAAAEIAAGISR